MTDVVRAYVLKMLRRDLYREPTEREVDFWCCALVLNGAFAPDRVERSGKSSCEAGESIDQDARPSE